MMGVTFEVRPSRDPSWWEGRQEVLNARRVPERRVQRTAPDPIPVRARIVWAKDGEELITTRCMAWTSRLALVELSDARCAVRSVPADVEGLDRGGAGE